MPADGLSEVTLRDDRGRQLRPSVMLRTMSLVDVRRLAAIDMYGSAGTRLRRRLILAEFVVGAAGGMAIGLLAALRSTASDGGYWAPG